MFKEIFPNIFALLPEAGGNVFLLRGEKSTALIDSSTPSNAQPLLDSLQTLSLAPENISLALHTHGHADHFSNSHLFQSAELAMHAADAKAVNAKDTAITCSYFFPNVQFPKITKFLSNNQEINLGGLKLQVIETPGHTAGSVCFLERKQGRLFSGDTLFASGFGRTDLPSGSRENMLESLKKLQKTPFKALFPGHGPVLKGKEENRAGLQLSLKTLATNAFL